MRPKKPRWVRCEPGERCFRPVGISKGRRESIVLTLDELEAVRLIDLEEYGQTKAAQRTKVHRSTVSRILASARKKLTDALVNCKVIKAEGGCCKFIEP